MKILDAKKMKRTLDYLKKNDPELPTIALINNFNESKNIWDAPLLLGILSDEEKRKRLLKNISDFIEKNGFA